MVGGRAVETSPIFVFRIRFYVHRGSFQARVYPRRWLSLSSRAKAFTLKGRQRSFVGDSTFHTSLRGAPLFVGVLCVFSSHSFWTSMDVPAGVTQEEGNTGVFYPPSFCGACLNFSREKDSAIPFPRRP